jgi:DNA-binding PadR family transcriptional regulator
MNLTYQPLSESAFYILLSLAPGPIHGYAILKEVDTLSGGRILLSTGTLYGALKRFLQRGWIERKELPYSGSRGEMRKAYALTDLGRSILQAETVRLEKLLSTARQNLSGVDS